MIKYFQTLGILSMINKINKNNKIELESSLKFHCYKFINNQINGNESIDTNDYDQNKIIAIVSALMFLRLFENEIIDKLELSKNKTNNLLSNANKNPLSTINCKLISANFLAKIKSLFDIKKIIEIMKQNQIKTEKDMNNLNIDNLLKLHPNYTSFLISKKTEFLSFTRNPQELTEFEKIYVNKDKKQFYYPMGFNIISDNIFDKLLDILNLKGANNLNKPEEIMATFNHGKLAFKGLDNIFCGNNMPLFYLYSAKNNQETNSINFYPEAILDFQTPENLFNKFSTVIKEDILYNLNKTPQYFLPNYNCKICLIFNQGKESVHPTILNNQHLIDNDSNKYSNQLLTFSFLFYINYQNFYDSLRMFQAQSGKIFLINKKYSDEIKRILQTNSQLKSYLINKGTTNIKELKHFLDDKFLKKFSYEKFEIERILNDNMLFNKSPKHLTNDVSNNLFYYENFQIINEKLFDLLKNFDSNFLTKFLEPNAIFDNGQVILFLEENGQCVINVGKIGNKDEFEFEYLIQSSNFNNNNKVDLQIIFTAIKEKGYSYFKNYFIKKDLIEIITKSNIAKAKLYKLGNSFNSDEQRNEVISEKLKALILISISQNIDIHIFHKYNSKKIEKVYLMNYNILLKYKFLEISSLNNYYNNIKKYIDEINNPQSSYDQNLMEKIISKIEPNQLKKIDNGIKNIDFSIINLEAIAEKFALKDYKSISIYKEFILIREKIYNEIKNKLPFHSKNKQIDYAYNDGDILATHDYFSTCIFFGNYN